MIKCTVQGGRGTGGRGTSSSQQEEQGREDGVRGGGGGCRELNIEIGRKNREAKGGAKGRGRR